MLFIQKIFKNKVIRYAYLGWFTIALFYFYQYVLRVAPGIMVEDIRATFLINAEEFATLGALSLFAYGMLQIPFGIIVDAIGVKRMCIFAMTILIIGAIMMSITESFKILQISRFIIGIGSGAAFLCTIKFIADHIPRGGRGLLMGATLTLGICGPILFSQIFKVLDGVITWQQIVLMISGLGIVILALIAYMIQGSPGSDMEFWTNVTYYEHLQHIIRILSDKRVIIFSLLAIGLYTPISALADLWGASFLKQKFNLQKVESGEITMLLYVGLGLGSIMLPYISEKIRMLNFSIMVCMFCLLGSFCVLVYSQNLTLIEVKIVLFLIGFFCGAEMMCFTGALEDSTQYDSGHIVGIVNTFNMLGGALIQQLIGYMLDKSWSGNLDTITGIRMYNIDDFQSAMSLLTVIIAFCTIISLIFAIKHHQRIKHSDLYD